MPETRGGGALSVGVTTYAPPRDPLSEESQNFETPFSESRNFETPFSGGPEKGPAGVSEQKQKNIS